MNTRSLERRARVLSHLLQPRPREIHCAGEVASMLATLAYQIEREGGDINAPVEWSASDLETMNRLDAWLEQDCREIEKQYNVRFID